MLDRLSRSAAAAAVVVGVDGGLGGRDALALARALAAVDDARLVLVHAFPHDPFFPQGWPGPLVRELREKAEKVVRDASAAAAVDAETRAMADSHPARALHRAAEEAGARLIVVGSSHRSHAGRVLLGDVARAVFHDAPCPVAVAPGGAADRELSLRRIGVGFDGSPESRHAVATAAAFARATGATLELVTAVVGPPLERPTYRMTLDWTKLDEERRRIARERIAAIVAELDVPAAGVTALGLPGCVLTDRSADLDLLFVGSRRFGPLRRVLLGSTAAYLADRSRCALVVVPRPAADGEDARSATVSAAPERAAPAAGGGGRRG